MSDPLKQRWCCFTCSTTFPLGSAKLGGAHGGFRCPNCDDDNTHPAPGEIVVLDEYHGEIGTKN